MQLGTSIFRGGRYCSGPICSHYRLFRYRRSLDFCPGISEKEGRVGVDGLLQVHSDESAGLFDQLLELFHPFASSIGIACSDIPVKFRTDCVANGF